MKYANEIQKQRSPLAKPSVYENPRNYTAEGTIYSTGSSKGMGGSVGILERYTEMLRERDEDLLREGVDDEEGLPPLSTEDVVRIYEALLLDLTLNSKPVITDLTIIAGEQREHGDGIADVICCRVVQVKFLSVTKFYKQKAPVDLKLPSLYLLDSIVKNIGCEYIDYFSARLPEVFLEAYRQVDPSMYSALRHLFRTWSKAFPDSVLQKIDAQLQLISESPLSHGIHVNPKYMEARRQSEHDNDNHRAGVASSNLRANRWFTERETMRIEPAHRQGRSTERDMGTTDWWRKHSSDRTFPKLDSSPAHNELIDPRALIDAYGSDRGGYNKSNWQDRRKALIDAYGSDRGTDRQPHWLDNQVNIGHLNESISNKASARSWKNTEEVEYDWEDMSPTVADSKRSSTYLDSSLQPQGGSLRTRYEPGVHGLSSNSGFRVRNWSTSVPASVLTRGTVGNVPAHQDQRLHSGFHSSQSLLDSNDRGNGQIPHMKSNGIMSVGEDIPPLGYLSEMDAQLRKPSIDALSGRSTNSDTANEDVTGGGLVGAWPPGTMQKPQQPSSYSVLPRQKQFGQLNIANVGDTVVNQGSNKSRILPGQGLDATLNKVLPSQLQLPNQPPGYFLNKPHNQMPAATLAPQYMMSQSGHGNFGLPAMVPRPIHLVDRPSYHGFISQGNTSFASNPVPNVMRGASLSAIVPRPGPPPSLQTSGYPLNTVNHAAGGGAFSGLISSLMSQGLISLVNQQDSIGVNFNTETLKVRHGSAIKALYSDLPRQCTACGIRFSDQELHRNHMDWHVTKNRMNKNRKQKASRKWFASASMWLSGTEASGPEAVPGFLPSETVVENQDEEEPALPADEEQTTCGLCGEPFDDFYSHETDEWMYRGAVYLNANPGSTAGSDRSQLGPIVHAKCHPDPVASSSQNVTPNNPPYEVVKRLRVS